MSVLSSRHWSTLCKNFQRALSQSTLSGTIVLAACQKVPACISKGFFMQRAVPAALLSALVFPGAGHLYLRRRARACAFIVPTLVAAVVFVGDVARRASGLADQVVAGTLPLDPAAIAAQLQSQGGNTT